MGILTRADPVTFILTRDRARAKAFYQDVLGLTLVSEDPFAAVFDLHGTRMRLTDVAGHVASPHTALGWNVTDLRETIRSLKARGITFKIYDGFGQDEDGIWQTPDGGGGIAWFEDPDGNNLSVSQDA